MNRNSGVQIEFYKAIQSNNLSRLTQLINLYGLNSEYFENGVTYLAFAILNGREQIVQLLLRAGASVNLLSQISCNWPTDDALYNTIEPAIVTATRTGDYFICEQLLKANANVDKPDSFQMTALHWACELNYIDLVKLLISYNARIGITDMKEQNVLQKCVLKNQQDILKLLIQTTEFKEYYYNVFLTATENFNNEILGLLMNERKNGNIEYDLTYIDDSVGSLLHYAVIMSNFLNNAKEQSSIDGENNNSQYLRTIEMLIENGIPVNIANKLGETPLHLCRNSNVVGQLLSYGAQMNIKEITGKTPLFTYFCGANYDMCIELLKHGSEIETIDKLGNSLLYAVAHSNAPINFLVLLVQAGVRLNNEKWFLDRLFPQRLKTKYPKLISYMEWKARNPLSLKELSRKAIRNYLNRINKNTSVLKCVLDLPVPVCLRDYMLYNLNLK